MSVLKYIFDSSYHKRYDIEKIKERISGVNKYNAKRADLNLCEINELSKEISEMALLLRSMYVYMKSQEWFDAEKFNSIVNDIDAMDGIKDGKITKKKRVVPIKNRRLTSR